MKNTLSRRQRQVCQLVCQGKSDKQIAGELGISEHTVASHLRVMFCNLGIHSRTRLSAIFQKLC